MKNGQMIGNRYQICAPLGEGGTSRVFQALRVADGRQCAVKVIPCTGEEERGLALEEAALLSSLHHPAIPELLETIEGEGDVLLVMEYIPGLSLSRLLSERGPQPQRLVLNWALQLCKVLDYLHNRVPPLIYGDLKPGNLIWSEEADRLVLVDFGAAQPLSGTMRRGSYTRHYAAPEQQELGQLPDHRTDLYGLGTTLFRLLTGAFSGMDGEQMQRMGVLFPDLSEELMSIIARCVRRDAEERFQSAAELYTALLEVQAMWGEEDTERGDFAPPAPPFLEPDEDTQMGEPDTERPQALSSGLFRVVESIILIHTEENIK